MIKQILFKTPNVAIVSICVFALAILINFIRIFNYQEVFGVDISAISPTARADRIPASASSNAKARWATIYALIEHGTFVIGKRKLLEQDLDGKGYKDEGFVADPRFSTSDKILDPATLNFYSSKPQLLSVLVALPLKYIVKMKEWDLKWDLLKIVRSAIIFFNLIGFAVYLLLAYRYINFFCSTPWSRIILFLVFSFGTLLSTMLVTLNNHLIAAFVVMLMLYPFIRISQSLKVYELVILGLLGGFLVTLEFPSLIFVAVIAVEIFRRCKLDVIYFFMGFFVPILCMLWINRMCYGSYLPAYAFFGTTWYNFPGSYWEQVHYGLPKPEIDYLRDPKLIYFFHLIFGHHGFIGLTPIFIYFLPNLFYLKFYRLFPQANQLKQLLANHNFIFRLSVMTFVVVMIFYVFITNNYGGRSCGPRWLYWLYPLALLCSARFLDRISSNIYMRLFTYILLFISVFSVWEPANNPWVHPWPYVIMERYDLLDFVGYVDKPRGILT